MRQKFLMLLAMLLGLSLLWGCTFGLTAPSLEGWDNWFDFPQGLRDHLAGDSSGDYPSYTPYERYRRPFEPRVEQMEFSRMEYQRPDAQTLCDEFHQVQTLVEEGGSLSDVLGAFDEAYTDYTWFYTMSQLAYIRYSLNLNDEFYTEENTWCEKQGPVLEQAMEECYIAMADSPLREDLEESYFEEGFFDFYDTHRIYSNDAVVELMQRESQLQNEYMAMQSDMTILWEGEETLMADILAEEELDYNAMLEAYRLYYEKYNSIAAGIYAKLIRVRKEMAQELGYESYAHFAYEFYYYRDYTPEQVADYTADIASELSPLYYAAAYNRYSEEMDIETVQEKLRDTAYRFGGEIATSYDFMEAYGLSDFSQSTSKMPGSYVTYLSSYEMPFLYVSPTGTDGDFLTAVHEFGHFVDGYVNCNTTSSIDCAEIFSQGLEYLSLGVADLTDRQRTAMTTSKVSDAIMVFLSQACYAEFEQKAFELPESKLNAQGLNGLFLECNETFGMGMVGMEDILAPGWIDIQHFFIAPFYVISYCVSNDAALQLYQRELEEGDGLAVYRDLLNASPENTILALLEETGLESPFRTGRMAELADFFNERLE